MKASFSEDESKDARKDSAPLVDPDELEDWVIHQDDSIIALNKPGWLVCHPSKNGPWSSLVGAVRVHFGLDQVYLAGRLDRETSGLVLIGKDETAGRKWQKALEEKRVRRSYWAILVGELKEEMHVEGFLGKDPHSEVFVKQRVTVKSNKSKRAQTSFLPLHSANGHTLCAIVTGTGRKHQIRVHAQSIGYPLVGEKLYGLDERYYLDFCRAGWNEDWLERLGMRRQALHSRTFGFSDGGPSFVAPLAKDFLSFLVDALGMDPSVETMLEEQATRWVEACFQGE